MCHLYVYFLIKTNAQDVDSTNYFCSPLYAPDEMLRQLPKDIHILSAAFDPLLDEYACLKYSSHSISAINFTRRLDKIGKPYNHQIFYLPHGFLNFAVPIIPGAIEAKSLTIEILRKMFTTAVTLSGGKTSSAEVSQDGSLSREQPEEKTRRKSGSAKPNDANNPNGANYTTTTTIHDHQTETKGLSYSFKAPGRRPRSSSDIRDKF